MSVTVETGYSGPSMPVAERIASAFKYLAVADWLVPDEIDLRAGLMAGQFDLLIAPALAGGGRVDAALGENGELLGAAVWLDLAGGRFEIPADYDERLAELCGPYLPRFRALDEAFERHHPDPEEQPHQHLAFCAVAPHYQRRGLGTLLLRAGLARLDEAGAAAYLEAANLPLTDWYGQYGFKPLAPIALPGGPSMYPMWRDPYRVAV